MEDRLMLSYFYGKEADQYSFYKIPKLLFTDEHFKKVSVPDKGVAATCVRFIICRKCYDEKTL